MGYGGDGEWLPNGGGEMWSGKDLEGGTKKGRPREGLWFERAE